MNVLGLISQLIGIETLRLTVLMKSKGRSNGGLCELIVNHSYVVVATIVHFYVVLDGLKKI